MSQSVEQPIIEAAIAWWHTRRPLNWTEAQHIARPDVRVTTVPEKVLCFAIADYLRRKS